MSALQRLVGILFVLVIWTGCGGDQGVVDQECESRLDCGWEEVIERACARSLDCGWEGDVEVCRQSLISATAAFTHVYGPECGEALLDLLDCESSLECDDFSGCQEEEDLFFELCF